MKKYDITRKRERRKTMKTKKRFLIFIFIFITLTWSYDASVGFAQNKEESTAAKKETVHFKTKTQQEVWQVVQAMNDCWTNGHPKDLVNYFHKNMVLVSPNRNARIEGGDTCAAAWTAYATSTTIKEWKTTDPRVDVYCNGNCAVVIYNYEIHIEVGGEEQRLAGRDMFVFVREKGKWWAVADQFSPFPQKQN